MLRSYPYNQCRQHWRLFCVSRGHYLQGFQSRQLASAAFPTRATPWPNSGEEGIVFLFLRERRERTVAGRDHSVPRKREDL